MTTISGLVRGEVNASGTYTTPTFPKPDVIKTPNWRQILASGGVLPVTPWQRRFVDLKPGKLDAATGWKMVTREGEPIWWKCTWEGEHYSLQGAGGHSSNPYDVTFHMPISSSTVNSLQLQAIDRAKNAAWDVGTFAFEADKTYNLVRKAHTRTVKRASAILSKKVGKIRTIREFADAWLEYRYGWRILAYDVESAQDSVHRFQQRTELNRSTAYHLDEKYATASISGVRVGNTILHGEVGWPNTDILHHHKVEYRVGAGVLVDRFHAATINPVMTAWELIPYSFIMDWFVDVGTYLGAHTPTFGRRLDYVWVSTRQSRLETQTVRWDPETDSSSSTEYWGRNSSTPAVCEWVTYDRYPVPASAPFQIDFNPRLDLSKFTDLAALAFKQRDPFKINRV